MFAVMFEVHPKPAQWDAYLGYAKQLKPELEQIDGFVDNIRYRSLTRDGWILSVSSWRDEKALVRWRTHAGHHRVQERGRSDVFLDYHLRVGQVTHDTDPPDGHALVEQRLDETETGAGTAAVLVAASRPAGADGIAPEGAAAWLGLAPEAPGLTFWDVYDAVLTPGDLMLQTSWQDQATAEAFEARTDAPSAARTRRVRVVRDYGMHDRREAPQYYPDRPIGGDGEGTASS